MSPQPISTSNADSWLTYLRKRITNHELVLLVALIVVTGGAWGFVELADEVLEGETQAIDERLLLSLRNPADLSDPIGPPWLEEMMRDFTAMGGVGVLSFITLSTFGFLLLTNRTGGAILLVVAIVGGIVISLLLKEGFDRPRPDLVSHGSIVVTASFPSGHSMLSAVAYLTLGAILTRLQPNKRLKTYILLLVALLTLLIGFSRVYLGVHWPTDVLAGWTIGAAWATLCWLVAHWLQDSGRV